VGLAIVKNIEYHIQRFEVRFSEYIEKEKECSIFNIIIHEFLNFS